MMKQITFLLTAAILLTGCSESEDSRQRAADEFLSVQTVLAKKERVALPYYATGTVRARERATLSAKVSGTVEETLLQLGRRVQKGDLLVRLNAREFSLRVEQAKVEVQRLERDYERERNLLEKKATTTQVVKDIENALQSAKARLAEAEVMSSYLEIRAPFDGVISQDTVRTGDLVLPGQRVGEITNEQILQVEFTIPASFPTPSTGTDFPVEWDQEYRETGEVTEVSPDIDVRTRTRTLKLNLRSDTKASVGQFVRVEIPSVPEEFLLVPENAVRRFGQIERLFVVEEGYLRLRMVRTTARTSDGNLVVASGLKAGEEVVLHNTDILREGQRVNR